MGNIFSMIDSYDGMLIETGGKFGKGKLGGDIYVDKCCTAAKKFIPDKGTKEEILIYLDKKIQFYELENQWIFQELELKFLNELKEKISGF